jgi:hypothetical protein
MDKVVIPAFYQIAASGARSRKGDGAEPRSEAGFTRQPLLADAGGYSLPDIGFAGRARRVRGEE